MYPECNQQKLKLVMLAAVASVAFSACESDNVERVETLTSPAVFSRVALGQSEANVTGEIHLMIGTTRIMTTNSNSSRTRVLHWSSSNPDVATVTSSGVAQGVSSGSAVLSVVGAGVNEAYRVIVESTLDPQVVAFVQVASPTTSLTVGGTVQMAALVSSATGTLIDGRLVHWSIAAGSAVTVNATGLVTAIAPGTATVQATVAGVSGYRSVTVSSPATPQTVTSVVVNSPTSLIGINASVQMSATPTDMFGAVVTGRSVVWRVYSGTAVSISATGLVTALSAGTAMVQATIDGVSGYRNITVGNGAAPYVVSFAVSPKTGSTLATGATRQFTSTAQWSDNSPRAVTVTYSATGGTISSNGLFTAGQLAGTFMVFASCTCGEATIIDTASLSVSVPTAQLSTLTISPKSVTLAPSATQQFTVTASWSTGATTPPPVTYSTNGGYVSSGGLFTAPATAGSYRVIVAHTGGTKKDTATVVVQAGETAPPRSTGVAIVFQDDFESGSLNKSQNGVSWTSAAWVNVTNEISRSGSRSLAFRQGDSKEWAEARFGGLAQLPEVFMQFWLYQPDGTENPSVGPNVTVPGKRNDKFFRLWGGEYGSANDIKFGASTWAGQLGVEYKYNENGILWSMGEGGEATAPDVITKHFLIGNPAYKGRWVSVRIRCKVSTMNQSDGIIQIWLDGILVLNRIHLAASPTNGALNAFESGYLLGWANNGFPAAQRMYVDDFTISTGGFPN